MTTYYNFTDPQALHAATHDEMVVVVPLPKQLPDGWVYHDIDINTVAFTDGLDEHDSFIDIKLPYPIGGEVWLRETWGYNFYSAVSKYVYRADYIGKPEYTELSWLPSQCQPAESIRYKGTVTGARVERVHGVTPQEIMATGLVKLDADIPPIDEYVLYSQQAIERFKDWFNSRYSKPKPIKEHGEIVGYRCFIWSIDSEFQRLVKDRGSYGCTDGKPTWKGKPLEVIVNGFVEIFTARKE